jgi:hypothetical protein
MYAEYIQQKMMASLRIQEVKAEHDAKLRELEEEHERRMSKVSASDFDLSSTDGDSVQSDLRDFDNENNSFKGNKVAMYSCSYVYIYFYLC